MNTPTVLSRCLTASTRRFFLRSPRSFAPSLTAPAAASAPLVPRRTKITDELTHRSSDHMTFDPKFIRQEPEEERVNYRDIVETFGDLQFAAPTDAAEELEDVEFVASKDAAEWECVERLVPPELIPEVPERDSYPSGFVPTKVSPGTYPYHVARTPLNMLPVYTDHMGVNKVGLVTKLKKVDGDLFALKSELDAFLFERYNMEFICQVAEVYGRITYRGDFEADFKEFLIAKGF